MALIKKSYQRATSWFSYFVGVTLAIVGGLIIGGKIDSVSEHGGLRFSDFNPIKTASADVPYSQSSYSGGCGGDGGSAGCGGDGGSAGCGSCGGGSSGGGGCCSDGTDGGDNCP